jgi:hypothetical protein
LAADKTAASLTQNSQAPQGWPPEWLALLERSIIPAVGTCPLRQSQRIRKRESNRGSFKDPKTKEETRDIISRVIALTMNPRKRGKKSKMESSQGNSVCRWIQGEKTKKEVLDMTHSRGRISDGNRREGESSSVTKVRSTKLQGLRCKDQQEQDED